MSKIVVTVCLGVANYFRAPGTGYLNAPRSMGKSLIHDPERAPLVRRAFDDYATGRYKKNC